MRMTKHRADLTLTKDDLQLILDLFDYFEDEMERDPQPNDKLIRALREKINAHFLRMEKERENERRRNTADAYAHKPRARGTP